MHISHNMQPGLVPRVAILGCGNMLFGDDGFGPAVINCLHLADLPSHVQAIDVGTAIREHLLDYLLDPRLRPERLIVVDAAYHQGVDPGTVRCCRAADLERTKAHDFSLHQFPTVNLLAELESETRMRVELLLAQAETLPDEVRPGLSPVMEEAVRRACTLILQRIAEDVIIFSTRDAVAIAEDGV